MPIEISKFLVIGVPATVASMSAPKFLFIQIIASCMAVVTAVSPNEWR